jgi:signal transduction histidine kinase
MSVPLNAGAETIGVMSLGSRDPSIVYTDEQLNLLQAIADQAAGAIVKARLLQESERRTRQLTSLNEVARSLTSTLELDKLLNQILVNAVEILNCEAGSLLLIDSQTDELVFEVATGPVAADFIGKRLPPGTGLVGKAVDTLQPIIANDVRRTKEWFDKPDQQTGFNTQDILVVPMQVKGRVIGVIEVINRKDGLPFTQDDQELLAAFTSQAAVAIENARLYTLTDQALEARVEELSVMQRIDRELNASLDVEKTMRITLDWAMRQSKAEAGFVGVVEEPGIRVMASQGYANELAPYKDIHLPLQITVLRRAVDDGQAQQVIFENADDPMGLLDNGKSQVAVPIRREDQTIGVIFLESSKADMAGEEALAFLSRLSDHATIAITNAKLYAEVEAANLAKSEFVSFVSHELKTPMTSIKGFTDLISSKVVGPVNETQANFLGTIRSNVDRMATLVSDLADISRIEAGRLRLDFGPVSVTEIIEEVTRSINHQMEEKQQSLTMQIAPELSPVWADRTRLIQILTNLVSNATKYSPQNGRITICAEAAQNNWDPGGTPKVVHISVQDTGFGIAPEDQEKIFQKFFRSEDQAIRDAPGTGLGLNITKTLVEMQGGKIWFATEFRKGTTFHITVPVLETA